MWQSHISWSDLEQCVQLQQASTTIRPFIAIIPGNESMCAGRLCSVYNGSFVFISQNTSRGQDLLDVVYKHLNLLETAYFGLRFVDNLAQTVRTVHSS